ncbi:MAG: AI-2E family transporter [Gammaproteobacteria bacterium]|nr:AI-2E family transporter [Gammaproteobacteria bacterium]MCP5424382.1 AI-2E family transporter [Gammaproteobacteria bacterium]
MNPPSPHPNDDSRYLNKALEVTIRIGIVALLAAWCFLIVQPFIVPVVWGIIIATSAYPGYCRLRTVLGERGGLAALIFTLLALIFLIVPSILLAGTLVDGIRWLAENLAKGTLKIPPPPESVGGWPLIGDWVQQFWGLASSNLEAALQQIAPHLRTFSKWLLSVGAGVGLDILQFIVAFIIAGVLLTHDERGRAMARTIALRLSGDRGLQFAKLAQVTVRSVTRGILGVAIVQALLAGLGFLVADVPGAGLWALLCLLLAIIQVGPTLILIPVAIYVFSTANTLFAIVYLIWSVFVGVVDNILKPLLLGRGVDVPMLVIFVGAIGGLLSMGLIGLFVGSIILVLSYKLLLAWLGEEPSPPQESSADTHQPPTQGP